MVLIGLFSIFKDNTKLLLARRAMNRTTLVILLALCIASCGRKADQQEPKQMHNPKYAVGQVWSYKTRPNESRSRLYIVQVTVSDKLGPIYNIYLDKLAIKNPYIASGIQDALPHAPVSAEALDTSVTMLVETRQSNLPDISEGYKTWRDAFDQGKAGVFTIPVDKIIQYIEDIANGKMNG
jgi:hypothetical protein